MTFTKQDHQDAMKFLINLHPVNIEPDEERRCWLLAIKIIGQATALDIFFPEEDSE